MSAIKKFFEKAKQDAKFKTAGPGVKLSESQARKAAPSRATPQASKERSSASQTAGAAALARIETKQQGATPNWSQTYLKAQIKREVESEKKSSQQPQASDVPAPAKETSPHIPGVFYSCPLIGPEVLSKEEIQSRIKSFLYEQLEEDRALTACLIIHTCNKNKEKIGACIETLHKYLSNIVNNSGEEKYRKIRIKNRVFQDKIAPLEGTTDFLLGAGFEIVNLDHQGTEEEFWLFPEEKLNDNILEELLDALVSAEPIRPQLDRATKVLDSSQATKPPEIPTDFYNLTAEEIKKEQRTKTEEAERQMQLRTKAMREKEEHREARKYRYCIIRIRFPKGYVLQGTFNVHEKLSAIKYFIREHLLDPEMEFSLKIIDFELTDDGQSLLDLGLPPASILNISFKSTGEQDYLKPEVLALLQPL